MTIQLLHGDCLELMRDIPAGSIDAVITDLPYGTTACHWDTVIPFERLWAEWKRIIKPRGAVVLFGSQPFTTTLIGSNLDWFKYEFIWRKSSSTNFFHAKNMPIKVHENILVFSDGRIGHIEQISNSRMTYNPQGVRRVDKLRHDRRHYNSEHGYQRDSHHLTRHIEQDGFPKSIIDISNSDNNERGEHPTQKPVALLEYLIRTYTNPGETVLDCTMGSGTTMVACVNTQRNGIGIELDAGYFAIAKRRIAEAQMQPALIMEAA